MTDICNVLDNGHAAPGWTCEAPADIAELSAVVRSALAEGRGLSTAPAQKLAAFIDRPTVFLDLRQLKGVREHVVSDLVIAVECGISLRNLNNQLQERGQIFAAGDGSGLLIDLLRLGDGGPLESGYGYLRSNVLGFEFFDKSGALIKCGGRVVKNVTGYDTTKLLVGSAAYGLPVMTYLRLFALPQKTVSLVVSGQSLPALLQLSHKLIVAALPFSALEIVSTRALDGYLLSLVFSGATNMVDDLCIAAKDIALSHSVALSEASAYESAEEFGRIELALSLALLQRISVGIAAEHGRVSIRPSQGRLTISCVSADQLLKSSQTIKTLLIADMADRSNKQSAMESYSYSVRVGGVLLDVVELCSQGAVRQRLLSELAATISSASYHPYKTGVFA